MVQASAAEYNVVGLIVNTQVCEDLFHRMHPCKVGSGIVITTALARA